MAFQSNRPTLDQLKRRLGPVDLSKFVDPNETLQEQLDASIRWVEGKATTAFDARLKQDELYDGNGTAQLALRRRPVVRVDEVSVHTPILGFIRTYKPDEIKVYRRQGHLRIFTYKLAVEQAMLNTLDYQAWGTIFPPLPQCVHVTYCYGFPQYDPEGDLTTVDGGATTLVGDQRQEEDLELLEDIQVAVLSDACVGVLGQLAGLSVGIVAGVSFDGYSRQFSQQPYAPQIEQHQARRDERLGKRQRRYLMSTLG